MSDKQHQAEDIIKKRYVVISYINEGGMQEVYRVEDLHIKRIVALKTPKSSSAQKRFNRSAILSARVNHPNVAKTLDFFEYKKKQYLIEEFIDGKDLQETLIEPIVNIDPYLVARVLHHLAKGLAASHHVGVIHRDLKPSNVMIHGGVSIDTVKITDFGISKMAEEEIAEAVKGGEESITGSLTMVGALPYMSPEMIENPKEAGKATDVWSLGAMLYELLSGEKPFGVGLRAVPSIVSGVPPKKPKHIDKKIQFKQLGNELYDTILRCLKKSPSDRPSSDELVQICERMCYQVATRKVGVVKTIKYNAWGFICCSIGDDDIFFHMESVYGIKPKEGDKVCFSQYSGDPAPRAYPVVVMREK